MRAHAELFFRLYKVVFCILVWFLYISGLGSGKMKEGSECPIHMTQSKSL